MIEKTFVNRVPTFPGRVKITPVAGQENVYDMERADVPTVEGTPMNKATFDSMVHSRLTGRYYEPTVSRSVYSNRTGITVNPIPTSGWAGSATVMQSGSYTISANSSLGGSYVVNNAFDGSDDWSWCPESGLSAWFQVKLPSPVKVKKIKIMLSVHLTSYPLNTVIKGSNDGETWVNLFSMSSIPETLTEYTLTTTGDYSYYRVTFDYGGSESRLYVRRFEISEYDVTAYTNAFSVPSGFPTTWDVGQRVMVQVPAGANTFATVANTLNGVTVSTVLQPNKRYELRHNGAYFTAKEV